MMIPKHQIDLAPYSKYIDRLYAQAVEHMNGKAPAVEGMMS
jgi:hypothetical protein